MMKLKTILALAVTLLYFNKAQAVISQIRWGSNGNPLEGVNITWSNDGTSDSIAWGYTNNYEKGSHAAIARTGYKAGTLFFKYNFGALTPNAMLYYKLFNSKTKQWDNARTYNTGPAVNSDAFSFTALGDCRNSLSVLTNISNLAHNKKAAFSLFNGDLTLSGTSTSEYDAFFTASANFLENNIIYHAEGNHDAYSTSIFSNLFDLPSTNGTNLYYSFKYGNSVFITLNSCDPSNTTQVNWLKNTLIDAQQDSKIKWKIISFHHPFFNTGTHTGDMNAYRNSIWKLFDDYGVDLILNGHDHNYQRSKPINLNVSSTAPVSKYGSGSLEGRCEIISGGAGASLYAINTNSSDAWAINNYNTNYNYVYCKVNGCKINIAVYGQTDNIIDSFTLDKTAACSPNSGLLENKQIFNPIAAYPNPSEGNITIKYSSQDIGESTIRIYDIFGREVLVEKVKKTDNELLQSFDLSKYKKGIYTLTISTGMQQDNVVFILK